MATRKIIDKKMKEECCTGMHHHMRHACGGGGAVYGVGFIGALIFYIQTATGFWNGVLGVLKALVWPAMLVYKLLMG
jgi:hypothetical protein